MPRREIQGREGDNLPSYPSETSSRSRLTDVLQNPREFLRNRRADRENEARNQERALINRQVTFALGEGGRYDREYYKEGDNTRREGMRQAWSEGDGDAALRLYQERVDKHDGIVKREMARLKQHQKDDWDELVKRQHTEETVLYNDYGKALARKNRPKVFQEMKERHAKQEKLLTERHAREKEGIDDDYRQFSYADPNIPLYQNQDSPPQY